MTPKQLAAALTRLGRREDADLYVYSAEMRAQHVDRFRKLVCEKPSRRPNAILFLTTLGGDPDAAYRLAACIRRAYKKIAVYVFAECKSAGTLAVLGADAVVLGDFGELGPLDVQLAKRDEILPISSGLDIFQALAVMTNSAFESFEQFFLSIVMSSQGSISAKTSAEIARELAVGIFSPMTAQIDPERLGEVQRAINIANAYGARLDKGNLVKGGLEKLVQGYPSHGFVIDLPEAKTIFKKVRSADKLEAVIGATLPGVQRFGKDPIIMDVEKSVIRPAVKGPANAPQQKAKRPARSAPARSAGGSPAPNNVAQLRRDVSGDAAATNKNDHTSNRPSRGARKARPPG